MKTLLAFVAACIPLLAGAQVATQTITNFPIGLSPIPVFRAIPTLTPADPPPVRVQTTNSLGTVDPNYLPSTLVKEVRPTSTGAEVTFGRHKVSFASDIGAVRPIQITAPDGRVLSCHPAFLVLENRATSASYLLGEVTN